jgi:hypothetical protein
LSQEGLSFCRSNACEAPAVFDFALDLGEHRRLMLIGVAAVILVAPTLYWSFSDQPHDGKPSHAQQAAICRAARLAAYRLASRIPTVPSSRHGPLPKRSAIGAFGSRRVRASNDCLNSSRSALQLRTKSTSGFSSGRLLDGDAVAAAIGWLWVRVRA